MAFQRPSSRNRFSFFSKPEQRHGLILAASRILAEEDRVFALQFGILGRKRRHHADVVAEFGAEARDHPQILVVDVVEQFVSGHLGSGLGESAYNETDSTGHAKDPSSGKRRGIAPPRSGPALQHEPPLAQQLGISDSELVADTQNIAWALVLQLDHLLLDAAVPAHVLTGQVDRFDLTDRWSLKVVAHAQVDLVVGLHVERIAVRAVLVVAVRYSSRQL